MSRPLLFDTTVLIASLRNPARRPSLRRVITTGHCYLSAVTIAELHAGARTRDQQAAIVQLTTAFARINRILIPTAFEWEAAGRLIARARWRQGSMEPRDHYPDALIAFAADRIGATIVTANVADFRSWITLGQLDATVQDDRA